MYIQLTPRAWLPDAHNTSPTSASRALTSGRIGGPAALSVSDVKPNISGYVIIGIVLTILVLVLVGVFMVRRCGAHRLFGWMYKKRTAKTAGSSSATLNGSEKGPVPQMSSRTGIIRVPPPTHTRSPAIPAQREFGTLPVGNSGESSKGRANDSSLSYASNNGVARQAHQGTSIELPVTDFVAPTSHHKHFFDERFLTASSISSNRTIRPHGIPLTPVPEDASAIFSPYFEVDEQTLYGNSQNSLIQH
ncbi:hypothetical protein BU17DRAFT_81313 [Hysterangium stoloniferum]|nr:hypothetical protein BU17DRAFT_81313 [Hysterangium stoloniferum]